MRSIIASTPRFAKKPVTRWICLIVLAGALAFVLAQSLAVRNYAAPEGLVTPFTLKLEGYDYSIRPGVTHSHSNTIARRSDGATVAAGANGLLDGADRVLDSASGLETRTLTLPNGEVVTISDKASAFVRWPKLSKEDMAAATEQLRHPPANCVWIPGEPAVESGTIMGQQVVAVIQQFADERITIWRAPNLGCQEMQNRVEERQPDGSYKLVAETKATSLVSGDPEPSLFELPSTYASLKPSELMRKDYERIGAPWDKRAQQSGEELDAQYFGRQPTTSPPALPSKAQSK